MHRVASILLFVAIVAFVAGGMFILAMDLFIAVDELYSNAATGAFMGAFFAFLFVRIGEFWSSYSARIQKGHSALVQLELLLNSNLNVIGDNIYIIEDFEQLYADYANPTEKVAFIWANRLQEIPLITEFISQPTNIDLINELFSLNTAYRKLNDSMSTTNLGYGETKAAFISKNMELDNYRLNMTRLRARLLEIRLFLKHEFENTIRVYSAARVLAKKRTLLGYIMHILPGRHYHNDFEGERASEMDKLRNEIAETRAKSQQEIEEALRGNEKSA